jgi:hypothetical protein
VACSDQRLAPEENTVGIPPADITVSIVYLLPLITVYNFLSTKDPCKSIAIGWIELNQRFQDIFVQSQLGLNLIGVELDLFDLVVLRILPQ